MEYSRLFPREARISSGCLEDAEQSGDSADATKLGCGIITMSRVSNSGKAVAKEQRLVASVRIGW